MSDINPVKVRERFERSVRTYEKHAEVQALISDALLNLLDEYPAIRYGRVLEIGSCTGRMSEALCRRSRISQFFVNDLVPELCSYSAERVAQLCGEVCVVDGDIEAVDCPFQLDLVISSSTFQWLTDFRRCLKLFASALRDDGFLVFSLFNSGTMYQVKELTGIGLPYLSQEELKGGLREHFEILHWQQRKDTLTFPGPRDVLRHIQYTGVSGITEFRWSPSALKAFESNYRELYSNGRGVLLDYVSTLVVARMKKEHGNG